MKSIVVTCFLVTSFGIAKGQSWYSRSMSWLDSRKMELSLSIMGGPSYFEYNTKAIDKNFPSAEFTLEGLISKRIAQHVKVQTGLRVSYKARKKAEYDYSSPEMSLTDFQYDLVDVDHVMSKYGHKTFGIPFKLQYHPGKLGLTFGALGRHFAGTKSSEIPSDWLAGRYDAGLLGGLGFDLDQIRVGVEYYYGFVNVHKMGSYDVSGSGPGRLAYDTYNRYLQLAFSYRFAK